MVCVCGGGGWHMVCGGGCLAYMKGGERGGLEGEGGARQTVFIGRGGGGVGGQDPRFTSAPLHFSLWFLLNQVGCARWLTPPPRKKNRPPC